MRRPTTGSARAASTQACSASQTSGSVGVAQHEEVECRAGAARGDLAQHRHRRRRGCARDPRCRWASAGRCGPRGGAGEAGGRRRAEEEARSAGERAPNAIQEMLRTKRTSITSSMPVEPADPSTSHIWCDRTTDAAVLPTASQIRARRTARCRAAALATAPTAAPAPASRAVPAAAAAGPGARGGPRRRVRCSIDRPRSRRYGRSPERRSSAQLDDLGTLRVKSKVRRRPLISGFSR